MLSHILSQDLHQQYRQGGMWNQNRHIQKICIFQTGAHLSMTVYKLQWSTKILSHKEKCLSMMYFWMLNSNMFTEFLCHPHFSLQAKGLESSAPGH